MALDSYIARVIDPAPGQPLVFAFHGTGGDETQFLDLAQALVPGGGVVSPRGDVSEHGAARFFRRTGEGVYDMADLARATEKMAGFVAAHREAHLAAHPGTPVMAFGYSNGANILAAVAMRHPDLFDRVALLHPLVTWEAEAPAGIADLAVLITAGERDLITPWPMSRRLIDWFGAAGADVATEVHEGGHELRQSEIVALQGFLQGASPRRMTGT